MSARAMLRRMTGIENRLRSKRLGEYTILAEEGSQKYWDSMHSCPISKQEIELLAKRGHQIIIREYPLGYLDCV